MEDEAEIEDNRPTGREVRLRLEEIMGHELKAGLEIQWQRFFTWLQGFGVVLDDYFELREGLSNGL